MNVTRTYTLLSNELESRLFRFRFRKTPKTFCRDLWAYKQQRFDFKDSLENSDVENFSQLVHILAFALSVARKFSPN